MIQSENGFKEEPTMMANGDQGWVVNYEQVVFSLTMFNLEIRLASNVGGAALR
jgi:hypothetical protein